MSTRANVRLISFCLFLILAMLTLSASLIYSAGFQDLQSYMTIEFDAGKVTLNFGNNTGSNINSSTCKVVYNSDKSKFKITGITPTISNGSVTNLSALTNSSGAEFYYFATNSAVLDTTSYTDPGPTYYISGLGTDANPAVESWYDVPSDKLTIYATFLTPNRTTTSTLMNLSGTEIFGHAITSVPTQFYGYTSSCYTSLNTVIIPNSVKDLWTGTSTTVSTEKNSDREPMAGGGDISGSIFYYSSVQNVILPNSIDKIAEKGFYPCKNLVAISIPNSVTSIGADAFYSCSLLTELVIPDSVTTIGEDAFFCATGQMHTIVIPRSVTSIGSGALVDNDVARNQVECTLYYDGTQAEFQALTNYGQGNNSCFNVSSSSRWLKKTITVITTDFPEGFDIKSYGSAEEPVKD